MIRRHLMTLRLGLMLADGVMAVAVFMVVSLVRFGDGESAAFWQRLGIDLRAAAVLFAVTWVSVLWSRRLYQLRIRWSLFSEARDIAGAMLILVALLLASLYATSQNGVSRLFLTALFLIQPIVTLIGRAIIRHGFGSLRRRGYNARYMLIAGTGRLAQDFADRVESRTGLGIHVIGHLSVPEQADIEVSRPILGTVEEIKEIFESRAVDEVAICLPSTAVRWVSVVTEFAAAEGKIARIPVDATQSLLEGAREEEFEGFIVRAVVYDEHRDLGLVVKRLIDIAGAAVGLVLLSPVLLVTALAVRLRDGSPILFHQTRVGLHGRLFTMHKFRTMVNGAEALLDELWEQNPIAGPAFQMADDPRLTPLGAFLRRTSLDELPQLWNVLRGEMSLVGPRPAPTVEVRGYDQWHRRRLSIRPGITGLAQVAIRTYADFDDRASLDLRYLETWSLALDVKILVQTLATLRRSSGQ